jgi:hypothetical protein
MSEKIVTKSEPEIRDPWDEILNGPNREIFMKGAEETEKYHATETVEETLERIEAERKARETREEKRKQKVGI